MSVGGPEAKPAPRIAASTDARPYPRLLVVLGVVLFCAGVWSGIYLAGSRVFGATVGEVRALEAVNQRLNWLIHYAPAADYTPNTRTGDCKTYAATKRAALLDDGWDPERLVVWTVFDERHGRHAVLVADGSVVLDNRFAWTQSRQTLERYGYRFLAPVTWLRGPRPVAAAAPLLSPEDLPMGCGQ